MSKESECSSVTSERPEAANSESDKSNETIKLDDSTGLEMKSASKLFAVETTQAAGKFKVEDIDKDKNSKTDNGHGSTKGDEETNVKEHELSENMKNDKDAHVKVSDPTARLQQTEQTCLNECDKSSEEFAVERKETTQAADKVKEYVEDTDKDKNSKTDNGPGSTKGDEETNGKEHEPCERDENTEQLSADECARVSENMKNDKDAEVKVSDPTARLQQTEQTCLDECDKSSEQFALERKETKQEADKVKENVEDIDKNKNSKTDKGTTKGDEETNVKEHERNKAVVNEQNEACLGDDTRMMDEIYEARSLVKDELRIVLIGKTGSGKSATGNLLTGTKTFDSTASASSVTKYSQSIKFERFGRHLLVVDTPGLFDTQATDSEITKEIKRCLLLTSPGIHALVLVSRVGRFTEEERNCVEFFKNIFGSGLTNYLMIVFTGKDDLDDDDKSVESYLRTAPPSLQDLVGEANNRYIAINNKASKKEKEASARGLIEFINEMIQNNGGNCYTSDLFRKAEEVIKQREEEERKRIEKKKRLERESIENNVKEKFDVVLKEQEKYMTRLMKDLEKQEKRHDKQVMDLKNDLREERKVQAERYEAMLRNEREENRRRMEEERRIREQERIAAQLQQLHLEQMIQSQMKQQRRSYDQQVIVAEPEKNRSCSVM